MPSLPTSSKTTRDAFRVYLPKAVLVSGGSHLNTIRRFISFLSITFALCLVFGLIKYLNLGLQLYHTKFYENNYYYRISDFVTIVVFCCFIHCFLRTIYNHLLIAEHNTKLAIICGITCLGYYVLWEYLQHIYKDETKNGGFLTTHIDFGSICDTWFACSEYNMWYIINHCTILPLCLISCAFAMLLFQIISRWCSERVTNSSMRLGMSTRPSQESVVESRTDEPHFELIDFNWEQSMDQKARARLDTEMIMLSDANVNSSAHRRLSLFVVGFVFVLWLYCGVMWSIYMIYPNKTKEYIHIVYLVMLAASIVFKYLLKRCGRGLDRCRVILITNAQNEWKYVSCELIAEIFGSTVYWITYYFMLIYDFCGWPQVVLMIAFHLLTEMYESAFKITGFYYHYSAKWIQRFEEYPLSLESRACLRPFARMLYALTNDESDAMQWRQRISVDLCLRFVVALFSAVFSIGFYLVMVDHPSKVVNRNVVNGGQLKMSNSIYIRSIEFVSVAFCLDAVYFVLMFFLGKHWLNFDMIEPMMRIYSCYKWPFVVFMSSSFGIVFLMI